MKHLVYLPFLILLFSACGNSEPTENAANVDTSPPLGLWVWHIDGNDTKRDITITRKKDNWAATINRVKAKIDVKDDQITIHFKKDEKFVGHVSPSRSEIKGYWHQLQTSLAYSHMVTSTILELNENKEWQGTVNVQPRPFNYFVDIFKSGNDKDVFAGMRNPERNEIIRSGHFRVEKFARSKWTLTTGSGEYERKLELQRINDNELRLDHNWFEEPITLKPATDTDRLRYFSRYQAKNVRNNTYSPPVDMNDGLRVSTPEESGFDRKTLDDLVNELAASDPRSDRPRMIHSLLVAHKGKLIFEEYFHGHTPDMVHDTRSLAKVFAPTILGALKQKGYAIDENTRPIPDVFESANLILDDARKSDISLHDLMTYTSGLDCNSNASSPGSEDRMWEQQKEGNYWLYTAKLPVLHDAGKRYAYCSGSMNLVGASLTKTGGQHVHQLFDDLIAKPLSFSPYHWNLAPNGEGYLGGGVYMRPRDILKIGILFSADGVWNGKQILDKEWAQKAVQPHIAISPATTGLSEDEFNNEYFGGFSGYHWRIDTVITPNGKKYQSYEATGNGGQIVLVVPDLDITAVFTGGNYRMGYIWGRWRNEIIGKYIIPSMVR